ncbi:HD domain-containing protein [Ruminococcaceae bacterium OttesenSCG-928-I18]|nr:HD domain-containing protein [Ruminococcaceae bacterium OttesenSCG-928-I18]
MKPQITIISGKMQNRQMLESALWEEYAIERFVDIEDMTHAMRVLPNLILLDVDTQTLEWVRALQVLKNTERFQDIPVICVTVDSIQQQAMSLGADDYISQPLDPKDVTLRVHKQISIKQQMTHLENAVRKKLQEAVETRDNMLVVLADIVEYRNIESGSHIKRVAKYAEVVVEDLATESEYAEEIEAIGKDVLVKSVPMHDVGKIGIPDKILLKPGKLTEEEFDMMKTHTTIGRTIIDSILSTGKEHSDFLQHCSDIAYYHHEWYDGSGYPEGLSGKDIPLSARIMGVVDVYDALVTERVYKNAYRHETAINMIRKETHTHFDPVVVRSFMKTHERCRQVANENYAHLS